MEGWGYHYLQPPPRTAASLLETSSSSERTSELDQPQEARSPKQISATKAFIFGEPRIDTRKRALSSTDLVQLPPTNSSSTSASRNAHDEFMNNPFVHRHGRRYLRDPTLTYLLPVDTEELHRQTLRTLLLMRIHGAPFCAPFFQDSPPLKVLDAACGSGFWSSACHDYFKRQGFPNVEFTGLDIAPLAPDLRKQGVNWRFVQHDLRRHPLPFPNETFDMVFIKDAEFTNVNFPSGKSEGYTSPLEETLRMLKPGGVIEIWETDWTFRTLLPHPSIPPGTSEEDIEQAEESGTYLISASTAFAKAQNRFLSDCNTWMEKASNRLKFPTAPCALTSWTLAGDGLSDFGSRRVAIPFGEVRWERDAISDGSQRSKGHARGQSVRAAEKRANTGPLVLTPYQASLRRTALTTTIQFVESLEPVLKHESGKRQDEWDRWWAGMTQSLLEENGSFNGECLELGAWWAKKDS